MNTPTKRRGPKPITGRYATREELEYWVRYWYAEPGKSIGDVAKVCHVSSSTVTKILNKSRKAT